MPMIVLKACRTPVAPKKKAGLKQNIRVCQLLPDLARSCSKKDKIEEKREKPGTVSQQDTLEKLTVSVPPKNRRQAVPNCSQKLL